MVGLVSRLGGSRGHMNLELQLACFNHKNGGIIDIKGLFDRIIYIEVLARGSMLLPQGLLFVI